MELISDVCIYIQSWAVSPIQYLLRQQIVDTFVFVSIIKITNVFVIVSISHK